MGPADAGEPPRVEQVKVDDQAQDVLQKELEKVRARLAESRGESPAAAKGERDVTNHGQLAFMSVPEGWVRGPVKSFAGGIGTRSLLEMHREDDPEVRINIFYRGLPMHEKAGSAFHAVLDKPEHDLTAEEIASLGELLRDKKDPEDFELKSARTRDVNGKLVLMVEGTYKKIQEDVREMFIDADGTGRVVQEVYFQAPRQKYAQRLSESGTAIDSIKWK